jgi:peptide chain release factor 1
VYGGAFSLELLNERPGFVCVRIIGKNAGKLFQHESGGHRWQRVPPTERRGRVHTSTITVVILPEAQQADIQIDKRDLEWKTTRSGGPGGQHMQKNDTAVILKHKPSGTTIRCESRSQAQNKEDALAILRSKLLARERESQYQFRRNERKKQAGSGMRGDKIRTIRLQDDLVTDHRTNKKMSTKKYLRGQLEDLHPKRIK